MSATMRKISTAVGVATLMLGMTGNAGATTTALIFSSCFSGSASCASFSSRVVGTFSDDYTFSVAGLSDADVTVFGSMKAKKSPREPIDDFEISLWRSTPGTPEFLANGTSLGHFGWELPYSNLSNGDYFLRLTGTASPFAKARYSGEVQISPVPEASTWIMMLVGVGLVGLALRRKTESAEFIAA